MRTNFAMTQAIFQSQGKVTLSKVELTIIKGLYHFEISGLTKQASLDCYNRLLAALRNNALAMPKGRIIASIEPCTENKKSTAFDLALAILLLHANQQLAINPTKLAETVLCGELSLVGEIKPCPGIYAGLCEAKRQGIKSAIIPLANLAEARNITGISIFPVKNLMQAIAVLQENLPLVTDLPSDYFRSPSKGLANKAVVIGQEMAQLALQIALLGKHPLLLLGAPGCGKTCLSRLLPWLLPPLEEFERQELAELYSSFGIWDDAVSQHQRPIIAPHHSITASGLIGGGASCKLGACSMSHHGVLFLDELSEYSSRVLALLREPIESKKILLKRAQYERKLPTDFLLIAASNPCPCGQILEHKCRCSKADVKRYLQRLSGPIWDRFQLTVVLKSLPSEQLLEAVGLETNNTSSSAQLSPEQIATIWQKQRERNQKLTGETVLNGDLSSQCLAEVCQLHKHTDFLRQLVDTRQISARKFASLLKVARTIADWQAKPEVEQSHIQQALFWQVELATLLQ